MPLPVLVAIVAVGIMLTVLAVHFTGGSQPARLSGADTARRRFADDFPDEQIRAIHVTASGDAAVLELSDRRVGIVQSIGDRYLTRIVTASDPVTIGQVNERTVALRMQDLTWRGGIFFFADTTAAAAVGSLLGDTKTTSMEKAG